MAGKTLLELLNKYVPNEDYMGILTSGVVTKTRVDKENRILEALKPDYIKGFSLLGGEPFEPKNQAVLSELLPKIKEAYPQKNIWCYTGYDFEKDLLSGRLCDKMITDRMLSCIDILVDGKFVEEKKNLKLRFKGSENQRIIDVKKSLRENRIILWEGDTNAV